MDKHSNKDVLSNIKDKDFERRIEQVVPLLTDEYYLYGTAKLIKDLYNCVRLLVKIVEEKQPNAKT